MLVGALAGCGGAQPESAPVTPSARASSAPSPTTSPSAAPTPTPGDVPAFDSIDGTWCSARDADECLTIELPDLSYGDSPPDTVLTDGAVVADSAPCYSTTLVYAPTGAPDAVGIYCPAGYVVAQGVEGGGDDTSFDRFYVTQNPPAVVVYFRVESLAAAAGG